MRHDLGVAVKRGLAQEQKDGKGIRRRVGG